VLQNLRNAAIVALLALAVTVIPGGGAAAKTALTVIGMAFLAVISLFVYRVYREQQMTVMTLSDGRRAILFGAVGLIALLIAGLSEMRGWAGGLLVWIALLALAVVAIVWVWRDATRLS
jgi:hypothetical protein